MPARRRLPRGTLTAESIVTASLEVIDAHGLDALSMRQLARQLGTTPMSLYRHFADKQQLLDAVLDAVIGGFEVPQLPGTASWRERVAAFFGATRQNLIAHPGVAQLVAAGPSGTPATLAWTDRAIGLLRDGGLDESAAVAAYTALVLLAAGFALWHLAESGPDSDRRRFARLAATSDSYPNLQAAAAHLARRATAEQFRFAVDRMLDGLTLQGDPRP